MNTPPTTKEAALFYAAADLAILSLWGVKENGECRCGLTHEDNPKSKGKHPHPFSHSVKGATTDIEDIVYWPDDVNIGVALGAPSNGLMVLDIDIPEVAAKLLDADLALAEQTAVTVTGHGSHIYFQCTDPEKLHGFNLSVDGRALGEVRGTGQYVVLPPSTHYTGTKYRWLNKTWFLDLTDDPVTYVKRLLHAVGVTTSNIEVKEKVTATSGDVEAQMPPETLDKLLSPTVRGLLRDLIKIDDLQINEGRSGVLFWLSNEIAETALIKEYTLTEDVLAGILKFADERIVKKYVTRNVVAANHQYRLLAAKALATYPPPEAPADAPSDGSGGDSGDLFVDDDLDDDDSRRNRDYLWDPGDGILYYKRWIGNAKAPKLEEVCNFLPKITVEYEVDDGEQVMRAWKCRFLMNDGRAYEMTLSEEDRSSDAKMAAALSRLPASFSVRARMRMHVLPAMQDLSGGEYSQQHEFAMTGWVEDGGVRKYILPSALGAIGPEGLDSSITINPENLPEDATIAEQDLAPYGRGVRPPASEEEKQLAGEAFMNLLNAGSVGKITPVLLQILAGPLIPAGAGGTPPLVHVLGGTGTLKTSFSTVAMSLFGTWIRDETPPPATWGSTPLYLQAMLHTLKDATLLVDDYKTGVIGRQNEVVRLIQQYADRTARGRATVTGGTRKTRLPRGLLLSNGEDMWEGTASAEARTVQISLRPKDIDRDRLAVVQGAVKQGHLQRFGGLWLQWLAQHPEFFDGKIVTIRRDLWRERLTDEYPGAHLRVLSSVAVLGAVGSLLTDFMADEYPQYEESVSEAVREATEELVGGARERDRAVKGAAPFTQLATAISEAMAAHEVSFAPRGHSVASRQSDRIPAGLERTTTVGFWWPEPENSEYVHDGKTLDAGRWVLLTQNTAMRWFRSMRLREGETTGFSWAAVLKDAEENHGGVRVERIRVAKDRMGNVAQMGGVIVPLGIFDTGEDSHTHTHREDSQEVDSHFT